VGVLLLLLAIAAALQESERAIQKGVWIPWQIEDELGVEMALTREEIVFTLQLAMIEELSHDDLRYMGGEWVVTRRSTAGMRLDWLDEEGTCVTIREETPCRTNRQWWREAWAIALRYAVAPSHLPDDRDLRPIPLYQFAFVVDKHCPGNRWHYGSSSFSAGLNIQADMAPQPFGDAGHQWDTFLQPKIRRLYFGHVTWTILIGNTSPGNPVRA
jgi:hypothetical protein